MLVPLGFTVAFTMRHHRVVVVIIHQPLCVDGLAIRQLLIESLQFAGAPVLESGRSGRGEQQCRGCEQREESSDAHRAESISDWFESQLNGRVQSLVGKGRWMVLRATQP